MPKITLLNTSIITNFGDFSYAPATLQEAKNLIVKNGFISAIGHESTAQILTDLLEVDVQVNRVAYQQQPGETALIFKVNGRPPEGKILTREEIEEMGYSFGILKAVISEAAEKV